MKEPKDVAPPLDLEARSAMAAQVSQSAPRDAAAVLRPLPDAQVVEILAGVYPSVAQQILLEFKEDRRRAILAAAPDDANLRWDRNLTYPEDSVGRLMEPPTAVFRPEVRIADAIERLRVIVKHAVVTYGFVTDEADRLLGVIVMRDLLLEDKHKHLSEIMIRAPFSLHPGLDLTAAMRLTLNRHFPVYPVTDDEGRLIGLVRGQTLFEAQAIEISAQAGSMVGVEKEERLATPWGRSLRLRHPWLQLNLLTAFLAAGVVGLFQGTIDRLVILAVFLPVLSGQSTNTGCQALAVALRGITLGELKPGKGRALVFKEALLGLANGTFVGLSAGLGMYIFARMEKNPAAATLALTVFVAMAGACAITGTFGAMIPLVLRRFGADPATASSIFLTTISDVASMGFFLALATWLVR
jgi:magnesium transporter